MLNQIFFIYRDDFVCKLVEKMAADEGIKCYTMSTVEENFGYILNFTTSCSGKSPIYNISYDSDSP